MRKSPKRAAAASPSPRRNPASSAAPHARAPATTPTATTEKPRGRPARCPPALRGSCCGRSRCSRPRLPHRRRARQEIEVARARPENGAGPPQSPRVLPDPRSKVDRVVGTAGNDLIEHALSQRSDRGGGESEERYGGHRKRPASPPEKDEAPRGRQDPAGPRECRHERRGKNQEDEDVRSSDSSRLNRAKQRITPPAM